MDGEHAIKGGEREVKKSFHISLLSGEGAGRRRRMDVQTRAWIANLLCNDILADMYVTFSNELLYFISSLLFIIQSVRLVHVCSALEQFS
jgi:hypothetical protein